MQITDNDTYPEGAFIVMTKSPELGRVKTRMQPALTQEQSLLVHCSLTQYVVSQWQDAQLSPIYYFVKGDKQRLRSRIEACEKTQLFTQSEGSLGDKMLSAMSMVSHLYKPQFMILLGTDCPFITKAYLHEAIVALSTHEVVIGPANDGGYVLLGMNAVHEDLFESIEWGSDTVFEATCEILNKKNIHYSVLEPLWDIDHAADLARLEAVPTLAYLADLIRASR